MVFRGSSAFLALAMPVALALSGAAACGGREAPARREPPAPASWSALDPLLAAEIRAELERLAGAPDDAARWRALAELYVANGLFPEAERAYDVAVARGAALPAEERAKLWYGRALTAMRDGRGDDGLAFGARAAELAPGYAPLAWRVGEWHFAAGDLDGARGWYERALRAQPESTSANVGLARVHLQREEFAAAAEILQAHALGGPADGYARMLLARALQGLGRADEARVLAARSRGAEPQDPDPWAVAILAREVSRKAQIERANQMLARGHAAEAIAILAPLLSDRPDDVSALTNLASALLQAGRIDESLERARAAARLDPAGYRPLYIEALALTRRGAAGRAQAVEVLERARALQPSAAEVHRALGGVLATRGDRAAALECYRAGLLYAPDDLELLRAAADGERESGGLAAARAGYERWLELAGGHAERASVIMALGDVLTRMEDFAGAVELLGPAVLELDERRGPLDPVVIDGRRGLVAALEALGRAEEAAVQRKRLP